MANSVSRQNETNPALLLATRVGKMALSCSFGISRCVPQGNNDPLLTKLVLSTRLIIYNYLPRSIFFYGPRLRLSS